MKAEITTLEAKKAGSVDLSDEVFGLEPRADILHRMVRYQLLKRQAGTHHAKDRSLVSGRRGTMIIAFVVPFGMSNRSLALRWFASAP